MWKGPTLTKATAPLTPRQVIGNRRRALPLEEGSALARELDTAIAVWAKLPLNSARSRKASQQIAALEERLTSLRTKEARHV
jgi:hypothetical protein